MVHLHLNKQLAPEEHHRGDFVISTDFEKLNLELIYRFLANNSYWAKGITREQFKLRINNALCFGLYHHTKQVGFARVVSDFTVLAHLSDVFILPAYRGQGLGKWLVEKVLAYPAFTGVRTWSLRTEDAQGLYARFGFCPLQEPEKFLLYSPETDV